MADAKLDLLKSISLFSDLDRRHLERLGQLTDEVDVPAGRVLWNQGDHGEDMFVIVDGGVRVERDGRHLEDLGPGQIIGEMALYSEGPRVATVTVSAPSRMLVIGHRNFHALMDEFPEVRMKVLDVLARRIALLDPSASN